MDERLRFVAKLLEGESHGHFDFLVSIRLGLRVGQAGRHRFRSGKT